MKCAQFVQIIVKKLRESSSSEELMKFLLDLNFKINPIDEIPMRLQPQLAERKITKNEVTNVFFYSESPRKNATTEVYIQILGKNPGKTVEYFLVRE